MMQDGHVVVWHDEEITPAKCKDTQPVVRTAYLEFSRDDVLKE